MPLSRSSLVRYSHLIRPPVSSSPHIPRRFRQLILTPCDLGSSCLIVVIHPRPMSSSPLSSRPSVSSGGERGGSMSSARVGKQAGERGDVVHVIHVVHIVHVIRAGSVLIAGRLV